MTEPLTVPGLSRILQWWIPSPCLGCRETVWNPRSALGLCPACHDLLRRWPEKACQGCARLMGSVPDQGLCPACRLNEVRPIRSTWIYQPPFSEVITGLKFRRLDYLGIHLGRAMAQIHRSHLPVCGAVVPVPLYWWRRLVRGYNQAELIALSLAGELGLPMVHGLIRRRSTRPQSQLEWKARWRNTAGVFAIRKAPHLRDTRVLLVDDVATTGATLDAAARALLAGGAREVVALTAARAARQG